jgi:hypothetical protein
MPGKPAVFLGFPLIFPEFFYFFLAVVLGPGSYRPPPRHTPGYQDVHAPVVPPIPPSENFIIFTVWRSK